MQPAKQFHLLTILLTTIFAGATLPALLMLHRWAQQLLWSRSIFVFFIYLDLVLVVCFGMICERCLQNKDAH
jgi:hypothetical protein